MDDSGLGGEALQQRIVAGRLTRTPGADEGHGHTLDPCLEKGEEAQRGRVGPVQVVDREQQRLDPGGVRDQPVEAMQRGVAGVTVCRRAGLPCLVARRSQKVRAALEHRRGERRRSRQKPVALPIRGGCEERTEQLTDERERVVALELASACGQDPQTSVLRQCPRLAQQRGLAQTGRRLDHREADGVVAGLDQPLERLQLALALD